MDYRTEHGQIVWVKRGYSLYEFPGASILCDAFFDTAAPLTVVPYTLSRYVAWSRVATRPTRSGAAVGSALSWQGIPCDLGTLNFHCVHVGTGLRSSRLHLQAKFPHRPGPAALERALVLGLNLLDENSIRLVLDHTSEPLSGFLFVP